VADAGALIPRDNTVIHPDASAKIPARGQYTKDFWDMRVIAVFTEPFFMITQETCLCRKVLYKYVLEHKNMFEQTDDAIRDYIFPLVTAERNRQGISVKRVLGTGFLIGNNGFALTAGHVIEGHEGDCIVAMFAPASGGWCGFEVMAREIHPEEDVAIIKLDGGPWKSFLRLSNTIDRASCEYQLFGYPDDTTFELIEGGRVVIRPDLIYNRGYVRRRYTGAIPSITGKAFFELSEVAGTGCSGAPVKKLTAPVWDVIGVYVGEKINDRATSVAYAVRAEAFRDWIPAVLGCTVLDESSRVSV